MIALHPDDWASVIGEDLAEFVGAGGALVRFVVGDAPTDIALARRALVDLADQSQLHFFDVDGSITRLQYPNDILASIAEQIDFRREMTSFLLQAVIDEGYEVPPGSEQFSMQEIAAVNDVIPRNIREIINARIRSGIMRDRRLVRDVRYALWAIAGDVLNGRHVGAEGGVPERWLRGQITGVRELRNFGIVQKVSRYNARGLIRSILTWLPTSGWNGSIVFVNALQLAHAKNLRDGKVYYTRAALSDVYEVMREFIDETDDMNGVLMVFAMPREFLSIDPRGRGMGIYQALQFRVSSFPEANLPNPLSNMVVLSSSGERRAFSA
ncbi:BREX system ATP-binding domain-containing protein [Mycolicibacterium sp. F2034L]|uniref:BREX system ATP-binding domain-containing protein n=1 Tax=Mycolicibacterium sp. F2034L TaxID=2926422 RepID=UPI001FF1102E|nr:BREX system ATP-binding domain-containing protein [Mycolicibacterium sp. F2034L]MCK0173887.1 DUF2791 family P-loop domain-containing protein [Mycolicibacterium sp. F2034L]